MVRGVLVATDRHTGLLQWLASTDVTGSSAARDLSSHGFGWLHIAPPCRTGVVLIPEGLVEHVHDVSTLIAGGRSWTPALQQTGSVWLRGLLQVRCFAVILQLKLASDAA